MGRRPHRVRVEQGADDEGRCATDLHIVGLGDAALNDVGEAIAGDALVQLDYIHPELAGTRVDVGGAQGSGVSQQAVVHFPELALF